MRGHGYKTLGTSSGVQRVFATLLIVLFIPVYDTIKVLVVASLTLFLKIKYEKGLAIKIDQISIKIRKEKLYSK